MALTATPYGLLPISDQQGTVRPVRIPNGIASGLAANIFKGQPVKLVTATGTITPITAVGDKIFGVFAGVEYTPTGARPTESPFWPSGASYTAVGDMFVYIWPAWIPGTRWQVQADGSVAQAMLGREFGFSNFANGSTVTGASACTVAAAGSGVGVQGQVTLVEFATDIGDAVGDAFTDLIVTIANPQVGFGPQVSIA